MAERPGVSFRGTGEFDRSEWPGDILRDARRYPCDPKGGVPASDLAEDSPFPSAALPDYCR